MIFIVMELYRVETMHAATTLLRSCHVSATNRTLARIMLAELVLFVAFLNNFHPGLMKELKDIILLLLYLLHRFL